MSEPLFEAYADYYVPLLKVMADLPDGQGQVRDVLDQFWTRYQHRIPPQDREKLPDGRTYRWANKVAWSRSHLIVVGLMDSPAHGIWRITQKGRDWLAENPQATRLTAALKRQPPKGRPVGRKGSRRPSSSASQMGITLEMLEQTRKVMPADQFRQVWGELYDKLQSEERVKAITPLTDKKLLAAARQPVQHIQDFLQGRGSDVPRSEEVCDWIHFCYTLGLYREAAALWQYVHPDDVNPWQYERTKRLATVCAMKTAGKA
ncbi:MAG: winged helix-turn-helix domain-containing protein [Anaerolineae bacterium]